MLSIKVNTRGNGYFYLVDEKDGDIATSYIPSLISKFVDIVNLYNKSKGFDEITPKESEILKAQIRLCEANHEQKDAQEHLDTLEQENERTRKCEVMTSTETQSTFRKVM